MTSACTMRCYCGCLTLGAHLVVDKLVVPVEILLLLLMNGWRVIVAVVMLVVMLISIVVEAAAIVVSVERWTKGWTSMSTRRRTHTVVMTLHIMMISMVIVVVLARLALRHDRTRRIVVHEVVHHTTATVGRRRGQVQSVDPFHNELITATATRRINVRRGTGTALLLVVQHADGSVLPDPVRNLIWVDPDGQLQGQHLSQGDRIQSRRIASLLNDGVHLAVDSQTAKAGTLRRNIGIPVAGKVPSQSVLQGALEMLQLAFGQLICFFHSKQIHQKIRSRIDFYSHFFRGSATRTRPVLRWLQYAVSKLFNIKP